MLKIESLEPGIDVVNNLDDVNEDKVVEADALVAQRRREAEMIYGAAEDVSGPVGGMTAMLEGPEYYTVTKMTPGVRDHNRVNIFLDGHFAFSLDVTQVIEAGVKMGCHVTAERLEELRRMSEFGKLYQRTLEWVLTRPHSVRETRDYLRRRQIKRRQLNRQRAHEEKRPLAEIEDDVMQLVIARLIEKKYLNDQKFAEFYVENRYVRRGISHKRLRMELQQKGVSSDLISAAMTKVQRDEGEEIFKVITKKRKKYNDFQLVGYLVRQGFNFQQAKDAVETAKSQDDAEWYMYVVYTMYIQIICIVLYLFLIVSTWFWGKIWLTERIDETWYKIGFASLGIRSRFLGFLFDNNLIIINFFNATARNC